MYVGSVVTHPVMQSVQFVVERVFMRTTREDDGHVCIVWYSLKNM
jgi:hypothetical protein